MAMINFSAESKINAEWAYSDNEVVFSDVVIGRGAFGEVRIAKWRNMNVAAKRLHSLTTEKDRDIPESDRSMIADSFKQEMNTLSKLRHPNLVLFLGITFSPRNYQPSAILTELMTGSLYDILENHKIRLSLPEILDISIDIMSGLEYLHGQCPVIVHRDISSKNILLDGNKAKIADLGQAKILDSSVLSRQTGMPGAMAYSAPEVLTGKYTSKIDIFSFGVLMTQMCCGEYPRIDKREDQLRKACASHQCLAELLASTMCYQPADRPAAALVAESLRGIALNDRYYPPLRRLPPQKDVGVMARRWMDGNIEETCRDIKLSLEHTSRRLTVEEQRWRDEADRLEKAEKVVVSTKSELVAVTDSLERARRDWEAVRRRNEELEATNTDLDRRVKMLTAEMDDSKHRHVDLLSKYEKARADLASLTSSSSREQESATAELRTLRSEMTAAQEVEDELRIHLDMQVDHCRELEARLEQSLTRWKFERENVSKESERCAKLRSQCAGLVEKCTRSQEEVERLSRRLHMYDALPMPEEIKARMIDLESDIKSAAHAKQTLLDERDAARQEVETKSEEVAQMAEKNQALVRQVQASEENSQNIQATCDGLRESHSALEMKLQNNFAEIRQLQTDKHDLLMSIDELNAAVRDLREGKETNLSVSPPSQRAIIDIGGRKAAFDACDVEDGGQRSALRDDGVGQSAEDKEAPTSKAETFRLHKFAGANVGDLLFTAHRTKESLESLNKLQEETRLQDPLERRRERDALVKLQITQTLERHGPTGLLKYISANSNCEFASWRGARAIREAFTKDPDLRDSFVNARCEEVMMSCMASFLSSDIVQGQCLRTLAALSFGNDTMRRHCGERGMIAHVLRAMQSHPEEESVLLHACNALTNLCHNSVDNRGRFLECGGVDILLTVMESGVASSAKLQRQVFWAIVTLAGSDEVSLAVVHAGGGSKITSAMIKHRFDAPVQQFGCWAISNLASAGEETKRKLKKLGALEVCRVSLETHSNDMEVIRQAQQAIGILTASSAVPTLTSNSSPSKPQTAMKSRPRGVF